jgi:hypothetical protein
MDLFKKNRAKIQDLIQDSLQLIQKRYNQANQLFTVASAWGQILFVLQNLSQLILFFIEDSITELDIKRATRENSVYSLAALTGHNASRSSSARGQIDITWNGTDSSTVGGSAILIPNYAALKFQNGGISYVLNLTQDYVRINLNTTSKITCEIMEGSIRTASFTGTGEQLQSFNVSDRITSGVDNFEVRVFVDSEEWKVYDSLYDIPFNHKGCLVRTGISSGIDVIFGNYKFGKIPNLGSVIQVRYLETTGSIGNINSLEPEKIVFEFDSDATDAFGNDVSLKDYLHINCTVAPQLGTDRESIELTRILAPKTSRSYVLANAESYITFFEKFGTFSIIEAFSTFNDQYLADDNIIYVLLVPDITKLLKTNETYFDIKESQFLLTDFQKTRLLNAIDESGQKIVTTEVDIIEPKISRFVINILLTIFEGYDPDTIKGLIVDTLSTYFIGIRRRDKIPRSDLIAIIESITGVDSVTIFFLSEKNENYAISVASLSDSDPKKSIVLGLDEFGDIVFDKDEIVIITGGWSDRLGLYYDRGADLNKLSSINIDIRSVVPVTYNTEINYKNKQLLKTSNTSTL